jgi:hypothetical protein
VYQTLFQRRTTVSEIAVQQAQPGTQFQQRAQQYLARALEIKEITSPEQYIAVAEMFKSGAAAVKEFTAFFGPMKAKAHAAWKEITTTETATVSRIEEGRKHLSRVMAVSEQKDADRKRREEEQQEQERQKRADADRQERIRQEEEVRISQAQTLHAEGKKEEAEKVLEAPIVVYEEPSFAIPVTVPSAIPKVAGVSRRGTWKARLKGSKPWPAPVSTQEGIESFKLLVKAVAEGKVPLSVLSFDERSCSLQAKSQESLMDFPGVEAYQEFSHSGRG